MKFAFAASGQGGKLETEGLLRERKGERERARARVWLVRGMVRARV